MARTPGLGRMECCAGGALETEVAQEGADIPNVLPNPDKEEHHHPCRSRSTSSKQVIMMQDFPERAIQPPRSHPGAVHIPLGTAHLCPKNYICSRIEGQRPREPRSNHPGSVACRRSATTSIAPALREPESLTGILAGRKKTGQGQWFSVRGEWTTERARGSQR